MKPGSAASVALALACMLPTLAVGGALDTDVDGVRVELTSEPDKPGTRDATTYRLRLRDADGGAVAGARVALQAQMADGMTVVAPLRVGPEPGVYRGRVLFTMEGRWNLRLRVSGKGKSFELTLTEHVGR